MKVAVLLVGIAIALGAAGLYRYESTRRVTCVSPSSISLPSDTLASRLLKSECQSRHDAADGEAQGAYLAYAAAVLLGGTTWFLLARRRRLNL